MQEPPINANERRLDAITEKIIGCAFKVSNALGTGFLEKVYENALAHELRKLGFVVQQKEPLQVIYDGVVVGKYEVDLLVEKSAIVEVKAATGLIEVHMAQCMNYLRATGLRVGLVINFATPKIVIKRVVNKF
jgi:GxxExxY protein